MDSLATEHLNRLWSTVVIATCRAQGITDFFVAPGSRCTPLTTELARQKAAGEAITIHQHFDERALAFCCVGYGKAANRPGVFICTSGTAVANALPAVIESSAEDIPFVLLTADRPPELRGTGANQTIDQVDLFGRYPRLFVDLECPTADVEPSDLSRRIADALAQSTHGPVHINCMFREPFDASDETVELSAELVHEKSIAANGDSQAESAVGQGGNTLVIASGCRREVALAAQQLATRIGCPFLADVTSGLRSLAYDYALAQSPERLQPQTIIHVGRRITSKRLLTFIENTRPTEYLHINETDQPIDPLHQVTRRLVGDVASICSQIELKSPSSPAFREAWTAASASTVALFAKALTADEVTEPAIAYAIAAAIPSETGLFLGNSMPVRDMDAFGFWPDDREIHVASNRGASGIDGTIATAVGHAAGIANMTTAVIGDLAALHDLNALSLVRSSQQPIVLVLINNDGGGIIHFLPVASQTDQFEQYFGTPHGRTFAAAAKMFDIAYDAPESMSAFREKYTAALQSESSTIIEVATDRNRNVEFHQQLLEQVRLALFGSKP